MGRRLRAFMMGRNGADMIYILCLALCVVLLIVNSFLHLLWITGITLVLLGYGFFRAMSKNVCKRRREDQAFRRFFGRIGGFFRLQHAKIRYRKTHVFYRCPHCRRTLRLPRISGEHTVRCPMCGHRFAVKMRRS